MKTLLKEINSYQWASKDDKTVQANYMLDVTRYVFDVNIIKKNEK